LPGSSFLVEHENIKKQDAIRATIKNLSYLMADNLLGDWGFKIQKSRCGKPFIFIFSA